MAPYLPEIPSTTYQCCNNKIDHIWGTIGVLMSTIGVGIMDFGIGPRWDHHILYVDISLIVLCNLPSQSINNPTHPSSCNLWSTNVKAGIYVDLVKHENIAIRIAILKQQNWPQHYPDIAMCWMRLQASQRTCLVAPPCSCWQNSNCCKMVPVWCSSWANPNSTRFPSQNDTTCSMTSQRGIHDP
jgi:hypothetical protein